MGKRTVFYVTDKDQYIQEAIVSAKSVKKHMPDVDTLLVTPLSIPDGLFDCVMKVREISHKYWFYARTYYIHQTLMDCAFNDYDKLIYLDCDTFFCDSAYELFDLLDCFDFAGTHAPNRPMGKNVLDIPLAFTNVDIGVNPMKNNFVVRNLWAEMIGQYSAFGDIYKNNDQPVLRDTLWRLSFYDSAPRLYILPSEYNLRFNYPCLANQKVKILHGRPRQNQGWKRTVIMVNNETGARSWKQGEL